MCLAPPWPSHPEGDRSAGSSELHSASGAPAARAAGGAKTFWASAPYLCARHSIGGVGCGPHAAQTIVHRPTSPDFCLRPTHEPLGAGTRRPVAYSSRARTTSRRPSEIGENGQDAWIDLGNGKTGSGRSCRPSSKAAGPALPTNGVGPGDESVRLGTYLGAEPTAVIGSRTGLRATQAHRQSFRLLRFW